MQMSRFAIITALSRADWYRFSRFRTTKSHIWLLVIGEGSALCDWYRFISRADWKTLLSTIIGADFALGDTPKFIAGYLEQVVPLSYNETIF